MKLQRFEDPGLSHYSYLLGSEGQAVIVDPRRDTDIYREYARANGLRILHVLETHIHADYASGARQLAEETGAGLCLSAYTEGQDFQYGFPHRPLREGDELTVGNLRIQTLHTPGHTPEHLSFLIFESSRCGQPVALFSGDFLFAGSLGRPDLLGDAAKQKLAGDLYRSVREKIADLPDGTEVYPAHGAGSLCGSGMAEKPQTTLGYERFCNVFLADHDESAFVQSILSSVPELPGYYRRMKRINSEGPPALSSLPGGDPLGAAEFAGAMRREEAAIVDLRRPEAFGGAHITGSYNIGAGENLSLWAGWTLPYDKPILLVGEAGSDLEEARRSLIRVGLDRIRGRLDGGIQAWIEAGFDLSHLPVISVCELERVLSREHVRHPFVLDVRSPAEWKAGRIDGAHPVPAGDIASHTNRIPFERPVYVICGSGYRSGLAASILKRAGHRNVINVIGGMSAWKAQGFALDHGQTRTAQA